MMFNRLQIVIGAVFGAILYHLINLAFLLPAAREDVRVSERMMLEAATTKAIGELTNEADRARVNRRLCVERGGLYLHGSGECVERTTQPDG
jgi:hypothetical protein